LGLVEIIPDEIAKALKKTSTYAQESGSVADER
jgi:hypothetical protein